MENFIPAEGKSLGFIKALLSAHPVPPELQKSSADITVEKHSNNSWLGWMSLLAGLALTVIAYVSNSDGPKSQN